MKVEFSNANQINVLLESQVKKLALWFYEAQDL